MAAPGSEAARTGKTKGRAGRNAPRGDAGVSTKAGSGGPHAGFAVRKVTKGWRNLRAARSSPDDVRVRQRETGLARPLEHSGLTRSLRLSPCRSPDAGAGGSLKARVPARCTTPAGGSHRHRPGPLSDTAPNVRRCPRSSRWPACPASRQGTREPPTEPCLSPPPRGSPPHVTAAPQGLPPARPGTFADLPATEVP